MGLRELLAWVTRFQLRHLDEEKGTVIKSYCPDCNESDWRYDFEKEGHTCQKCGYFQRDI